jgi:hypothetical protein
MTATANTQVLRPTAGDQTPPSTRSAGVGEFSEGLRWARSVLNDPIATSVYASGMSQADLRAIEQAAAGTAD